MEERKGEVGRGEKRGGVNFGSVKDIVTKSGKEDLMEKFNLGIRVYQIVFCLISFSVMDVDRTQCWSGDSFDRYKEYIIDDGYNERESKEDEKIMILQCKHSPPLKRLLCLFLALKRYPCFLAAMDSEACPSNKPPWGLSFLSCEGRKLGI
ncbi:CASP-like protein 4A3 [Bienertia sinuspersici]